MSNNKSDFPADLVAPSVNKPQIPSNYLSSGKRLIEVTHFLANLFLGSEAIGPVSMKSRKKSGNKSFGNKALERRYVNQESSMSTSKGKIIKNEWLARLVPFLVFISVLKYFPKMTGKIYIQRFGNCLILLKIHFTVNL